MEGLEAYLMEGLEGTSWRDRWENHGGIGGYLMEG